MPTLFSTAYLPPVSYLLECNSADEIIIEQQEHFIKQTYRNRCHIYGPNGKQALIIPVVHENLFRIPLREVKISFDSRWNKIHWKAICSAYRNSPFFEFYEDGFQKIYESPSSFLLDFNLKLLETILINFKIKKSIKLTEDFEKTPAELNDHRNIFHPKKNQIKINPYHQVFSDRYGFLNDLSSIDVLFNGYQVNSIGYQVLGIG